MIKYNNIIKITTFRSGQQKIYKKQAKVKLIAQTILKIGNNKVRF